MNQPSKLSHTSYDLVVIGGGINGAAIARDAALRGISVCLLEKEDFGSGASSKTSKLAHGGLRYLEKFHFSLVRESLAERELLLKNASHLVHPLPFLVPVYQKGPHYLTTIRLGLSLYDLLGGSGLMPKHRKLSREEVLETFPLIKREDLKGGCLYYDGQMNDARLVIENILSAEDSGAKVYNYSRVDSFIYDHGKVVGVVFTNMDTQERGEVYGRKVVKAAGAWTSEIVSQEGLVEDVVMAPTKGVHIVVPGVHVDTALLLNAPQDGRVFFVMPWEGSTLIGTTDTYYQGDLDAVLVDKEDRQYLLDAYNFYFPDAQIDEKSIIATFAGLRPLVAQNQANPSDVGREHVIHEGKDGLITVAGGKYTTHRLVAEEVVDKVVGALGECGEYKRCVTRDTPLPGAEGNYSIDELSLILKGKGLSDDVVEHLIAIYGTQSLLVADYIMKEESGSQQICHTQPHVYGEVDYAIAREHARHLSDWFFRRTSIGEKVKLEKECVKKTAERFALKLGWDEKRIREEISAINSIAEISLSL